MRGLVNAYNETIVLRGWRNHLPRFYGGKLTLVKLFRVILDFSA